MAATEKRLVVNDSRVAGRVIDGEAIVIDLATGLYYSMDGVGGHVWELIEAGHAPGRIAELIAVRYDVAPERARDDLDVLVRELLAQGLVVETDGESPSLEPAPPGARPAYAAPELNRYDDMGDLLALDPPMPGLPEGNWQRGDEDGPRDRAP